MESKSAWISLTIDQLLLRSKLGLCFHGLATLLVALPGCLLEVAPEPFAVFTFRARQSRLKLFDPHCLELCVRGLLRWRVLFHSSRHTYFWGHIIHT
jgi:hypothetical protein